MNALRALVLLAAACGPAVAAAKWVTVWTASMQGPYPTGNASAQPNLRFAFPTPETGARDQTFRLIVVPGLWAASARLRFSNVFGTRPVTFDGVYAGLHLNGGALRAGTNRGVHFGGTPAVTIAPGESVWSDAVALPRAAPGDRMAISFHIAGESGPMTWHAKALTTSYLSAPGSGAKGAAADESAFPFTTTSWYFLDAVDMMAPAETRVVVAFGDSITDGTASTLNGDDRWPDVLARRLRAQSGARYVVVNAGIGGNRVVSPAEYSVQKPFSGGPSAKARLQRDVLSLSGVSAVIWLEGINDFNRAAGSSAEAVQAGMKEAVAKIRAAIPGVHIIGGTVTSALGSASAGTPDIDEKRHALNQFIRTSGVFDGVADFDRATTDPATGGLRAEFVPDSTIGGAGDKLHPNRAGYQAMGMSIDLGLLRE
jgi:lysophospholipase L1-like esterase